MTHTEVENLKQAMLTVIANLSEHDLRNIACIEDCYYCSECLKEVCPTRDMSWDEDGELSCELAWIRAAEKLRKGKSVKCIGKHKFASTIAPQNESN